MQRLCESINHLTPQDGQFLRKNMMPLGTLLLCVGASVSYAKYAACFPLLIESNDITAATIDFNWLSQLPLQEQFFVVYCALSAFLINLSYQYINLRLLHEKLAQEVRLLISGIAVKRFYAEVFLALLSAVPGGAISGDAFSGEIQWFGRLLGFTIYFTYSFLGAHQLIKSHTDPEEIFYQKFIQTLNQINPSHPVGAWCQGKDFSNENIELFLNVLFLESITDASIIPKISRQNHRKTQLLSYFDFFIAAILTGGIAFIYAQSGFSGLQILSNDTAKTLPDYAKILLGFVFAAPLMAFIFFNTKFISGPFLNQYFKATSDYATHFKKILLLILCIGSATWGYSLGTEITHSQNIFSPFLNGRFGTYFLPINFYLALLLGSLNGLTPFIVNRPINLDAPQKEDLIAMIEKQMPREQILKFQSHRFFTHAPSVSIEAENQDQINFETGMICPSPLNEPITPRRS